ncbi:hypothetical protein M3Y99_00172100 [Aphelenchoides fujianensis]|nr:hypothetical protein M3Y99_00172100 [Aphelenchoides fujianensis]
MAKSAVFFLLFAVLVQGNLDSPTNQGDKLGPLGRHLFLFRVPEEWRRVDEQTDTATQQSAQQTSEPDYYDAVARGLDDGDKKQPVLSPPEFDAVPALKINQKDFETKRLSNFRSFQPEPPTAQVMVEPAERRVVDGDTGPPSIQPPRDFFQPPPSSSS